MNFIKEEQPSHTHLRSTHNTLETRPIDGLYTRSRNQHRHARQLVRFGSLRCSRLEPPLLLLALPERRLLARPLRGLVRGRSSRRLVRRSHILLLKGVSSLGPFADLSVGAVVAGWFGVRIFFCSRVSPRS